MLSIQGRHCRVAPQAGMALITALVMVLILGMLSLAIAKQSSHSLRNAALFQDHAHSYFNTASAINEAEAVFKDNAYITDRLDPDSHYSLVLPAFAQNDWWKEATNWAHATALLDDKGVPFSGEPVYIIEDLGVESGLMLGVTVPKRRFYRVTARASGRDMAVSYHRTHHALME